MKRRNFLPRDEMRLAGGLVAIVVAGGVIVGATAATAGPFHVEYSFKGGKDGSVPDANLMNYRGMLYGTAGDSGAHGFGTVYRLDPATGGKTDVYSFVGGRNAAYPESGLIDVGGILYGTTVNGGSANCSMGCGTVFSVDPTTGAEKVVYSFKGGKDGAMPQTGSLVRIGDSVFGTTSSGGGNNFGVVFSVDLVAGSEKVLHAFKGGRDGEYPYSSVIDLGGTLYGMTVRGGSSNCQEGCGTVFSVDPATGAETVVYDFKGGGDGDTAVGPLTDVGGSLYGMTLEGGSCCGTIFSLDPATGVERRVYAFKGGSDGADPEGNLTKVGGKLYGVTNQGGDDSRGTIFSLVLKTGVERVIHVFTRQRTGMDPGSGLLFWQGRLYGTTIEGGRSTACGETVGCGTVFSLRP